METRTGRETPSRRKREKKRPDTGRQAMQARKRRAERQQLRNKRTRRPAPAVVYTEPVPFNRRRLLLQLITVAAVVLALVLGMSIFFKVEKITVSGANAYSEWTIREASGIEEGNYLMTFNRTRARCRIIAELPYVKSVRIGIKLPDTVNIVIEELDVVYAIQSYDGLWWLMSSQGKVVEMTDAGTAAGYTKVLGVTLEDPVVGETAVVRETSVQATAQTDESGNQVGTIPVVVTDGERLEVALEILQALELNDIVGEAASVDVTDLSNIELWYGTQYQVKLGDRNRLEYKTACMCAAIESPELKTGYGVLDVSFTVWEDQVGYTPFE